MSSSQTPSTSRRGRSPIGRSRGGRHWGLISYVAPVVAVGLTMQAFAIGSPAFAAQGPVGLGTADSFAVLAGSGITNTGPTTIGGDVGTFPTPSETGFGSITLDGTNHAGDAVTQGAKNDLVAGYNAAAGRTPATNVPVELGGSTLLAGVYTSPTLGLTGTLSLDAKGNPNAEFIFKAATTLITASNSRVLLLNGANPCHIVWQVGSSATLNTGTQFAGEVLALTSITAETGATIQGRLLARNGAVTLDSNVITAATCAPPAGAPLTVGATPTATGPPATTPRGTPTTAPPASPRGLVPSAPPSATPPSATPPSGSPPSATPPSGSPPSGSPPSGSPPSGSPPSATPPSATPPSATPPSGTPPLPPLPLTGANLAGLVEGAFALVILGTIVLLMGSRRGANRAS